MADLVFIAVIVAFFGLAALLVIGCERIIGPDEGVVGTRRVADPEPGRELAA
jgi:hypothetical protein